MPNRWMVKDCSSVKASGYDITFHRFPDLPTLASHKLATDKVAGQNSFVYKYKRPHRSLNIDPKIDYLLTGDHLELDSQKST